MRRRTSDTPSFRRRLLVSLGTAVALAVAVTACGTGRDSSTSQTTPQTSTPLPTSTSSEHANRLPYPLVWQRSGGIAGFDDTLTVQADGRATLRSRGQSPVSCTVGRDVVRRLDTALRKVPPSSGQPDRTSGRPWQTSMPDELFIYLVIADRRIRSTDVTSRDPGYRELFTLMNDIFASVRSGDCRALSSMEPTAVEGSGRRLVRVTTSSHVVTSSPRHRLPERPGCVAAPGRSGGRARPAVDAGQGHRGSARMPSRVRPAR